MAGLSSPSNLSSLLKALIILLTVFSISFLLKLYQARRRFAALSKHGLVGQSLRFPCFAIRAYIYLANASS